MRKALHPDRWTFDTLSIRSLFCFALMTVAIQSSAQNAGYRDLTIPSGLSVVYPTPEHDLIRIRDQENMPAMRKHAWAVFSGLIQPAVLGHAEGAAVWETWYSKREIDAGCRRQTFHRIRELERPVEIMAGFMPQDREPNAADLVTNSMASAVVFFKDVHAPRAQVLYNSDACRHIRLLGLRDGQVLDKQNQDFNKSEAPPEERNVPEFPVNSVIVKNVWLVVAPGINSIKLWKPSENRDALSWTNVEPAKDGEPCNLPNLPDSPILTSCFYNIRVTDDNFEEIRQAEEEGMPSVCRGCVLILVGLHVMTKEIADWTWSTFWWSPEPNQSPYGSGRPGTKFIPPLWRNYVMDTTLSMVTPLEKDPLIKSTSPGTACSESTRALQDAPRAKICFNPYLERMLNGSSSNCMNCHKQASFHRLTPDPTVVVQRGYLGSDAPCFDNHLRVDYLWSLTPPESESKLFQFERELREHLLIELKNMSPD